MKSNKKKIPTVRNKNRQAYFEKRLSKVSPIIRLYKDIKHQIRKYGCDQK